MSGALSPSKAAELAAAAYEGPDGKWSQFQQGTPAAQGRLFGATGGGRFIAESPGGLTHLQSALGFLKQEEGGDMLLATRGTASLADAITDARTAPKLATDVFGNVHWGFHTAFSTYRDQLVSALPSPGKVGVIHCVGHSLGGALATLNAHFLAARGYQVKLYAFGCPRVYFDNSAVRFNQAVGCENVYRVSHWSNPVPMLPQYPFWHVGGAAALYELPFDASHVLGINVNAHRMANYRASVDGASWNSLRVRSQGLRWEDRIVAAMQSDENLFSKLCKQGTWVVAKALRALVQVVGKSIGSHLTIAGIVLDASVSFVDAAAYVLWQGLTITGQFGRLIGLALRDVAIGVGMQIKAGADLTHLLIRAVLDRLLQIIVFSAPPAIRAALSEHTG